MKSTYLGSEGPRIKSLGKSYEPPHMFKHGKQYQVAVLGIKGKSDSIVVYEMRLPQSRYTVWFKNKNGDFKITGTNESVDQLSAFIELVQSGIKIDTFHPSINDHSYKGPYFQVGDRVGYQSDCQLNKIYGVVKEIATPRWTNDDWTVIVDWDRPNDRYNRFLDSGDYYSGGCWEGRLVKVKSRKKVKDNSVLNN